MIDNEFQKSEQLRDLEMLREMKPSWQLARLEPLIPTADSDVKSPEWGKTILVNDRPNDGGQNGAAIQPGSERVICAVQSGSTFIPKIMIPVQGTIFENA